MTIRHALPPAATAEDVVRLLPQLAEHAATRRGLMLAPLLAALPLGLMGGPAAAIDPAQTQVTLPEQYQWKPALAGVPAALGRDGAARWRDRQARALCRAHQMVPGLHERAA